MCTFYFGNIPIQEEWDKQLKRGGPDQTHQNVF